MSRPYNDSTVGLLANPRLCLSEKDGDIHYSFQVYFKEIDAGVCTDDLSEVERYLAQLLPTSNFVICPGIRDYLLLSAFRQKTWWSGMNLSIGVSPPAVLSGMSQTTSSKHEVSVVLTAVNPVSSLSITSANCKKELRSFQHLLICTVTLQVLIMRYQVCPLQARKSVEAKLQKNGSSV